MNSRSRKANPNSPLYQAILKLKTPEECYNFLMDLCTVPSSMPWSSALRSLSC